MARVSKGGRVRGGVGDSNKLKGNVRVAQREFRLARVSKGGGG